MGIREYNENDFEKIKELYLNGRKGELSTCGVDKIIPMEKDEVKLKKFRCGKIFLYENNNEIVSFVCINKKEISLLYVHENYRGKGIGRKVLNKGLEIAGEGATLDVLLVNNRARNLYNSLGFREYNRLNRSLDNKEVVILQMIRNLG